MSETVANTQQIIQPQAGQVYQDPAVERTARDLLSSYFGPSGLMGQPTPIPMQQVAGLSPMEIQARNMAGGLGGFAPQLNQAQQYYQQSAMGYNPQMAQSFMNPYQSSVIDPQMKEIQRLGDAQKRQARAQQVQSGAFGGSRGAVQEAEINRNVLDKQAQFGSDLAYKGYGDAMRDSMSSFNAMQNMRAGAAQGIAGLGRQGFNMLSDQIGLVDRLGGGGRGIQDRALGYQFDAANRMAREPYERYQQGASILGGLSGFLPQYSSGYGGGQQNIDRFENQSRFDRFLGDADKFKKFMDMFD